jgi:hypothetical protein
MCDQKLSCRRFDPDLCPLLQGLSPEAKQKKMAENPSIRKCIEALEGDESPITKQLAPMARE